MTKNREATVVKKGNLLKKSMREEHKKIETTYSLSINNKTAHSRARLEPDILECKVKCALGSIIANKATGSDGISPKLFQILKDDAVKMLHAVCQQIWKSQQWPQNRKRSGFYSSPKEGKCQRMFKLLYSCTYFTC